MTLPYLPLRARLVALLTCVLTAGCVALPAAADALPVRVTVGIGDQKPGMFSDPLFRDLGVRDARIVVPWDVLTVEWQEREVDEWMQAANDSGSHVLVTFSHSRVEGRRRVLPSPERFKYEFKRFRARYPWAQAFAVWNEPNHCGEPTCHRPALVAAYYRKLRSACTSCTILAAEVLDMPNMTTWTRALRRALGFDPKYWGLHNYVDANRMTTERTRAFLRAVRGEVWLTETGGLVARRNRRKETVGFTEGSRHAASVTRFVLDQMARVSPRITRVYLYHWDTRSRGDSWDSALIGPSGPRPAFDVLVNRLAGQRARAARAAARQARQSGTPSPARRS
jgi:hypothetical protein